MHAHNKLAWEPSFARKLNFISKSQLTKLRIFNLVFLSGYDDRTYIQTNKQTSKHTNTQTDDILLFDIINRYRRLLSPVKRCLGLLKIRRYLVNIPCLLIFILDATYRTSALTNPDIILIVISNSLICEIYLTK